MPEVLVYIPTGASIIDPGSGIVGRNFAGSHPWHGIEVYFEGNRFGSSNIKTFADRVYHAADRMVTNYPTVARAVMPVADLERVGTFDGQRVSLVSDGGALTRLARWIGAGEVDGQCFIPDSSRLEAELRRST